MPPCRILIVDDNNDAAEMLRLGLEMLGHVVFVAHDGPSALDVLGQAAPNLALLDIGLPGMDGYELAARIQAALTEGAPVLVAITGYGRVTDEQRARTAGFIHHLVKPVELKAITDLIATVRPR